MLRQHLRKFERRFVRAYLRWGKQKRPPISINVEPTNMCNLACPICPHGEARACNRPLSKRAKGYLSLTTFDRILAECSRLHICTMAFYLHGEPFLNPDLPEMLRRAKGQNMLVTLFSNGLSVEPDQIEQTLQAQPGSLTLSMDLNSREGYSRYKGQDLFDQACEQFQMITSVFANVQPKTRLTLRTLYNGESREEIRRFLDKYFAVPQLESIQVTHTFPWPDRRDADILAKRLIAKNQRECSQVWNALNICWDGTVTPCSYDYDAEYPIGNILDSSLEAIVNSSRARHFRRMHILGKREHIPICANCLLPGFVFDIITISRIQYAAMNSKEKHTLFDRITHLQFNPADDFSEQT